MIKIIKYLVILWCKKIIVVSTVVFSQPLLIFFLFLSLLKFGSFKIHFSPNFTKSLQLLFFKKRIEKCTNDPYLKTYKSPSFPLQLSLLPYTKHYGISPITVQLTYPLVWGLNYAFPTHPVYTVMIIICIAIRAVALYRPSPDLCIDSRTTHYCTDALNLSYFTLQLT